MGPGGVGQEVRPLCTGRHDPITCLGSEGYTGFPRGVGQEASVLVKGLALRQTRWAQVPMALLANCATSTSSLTGL